MNGKGGVATFIHTRDFLSTHDIIQLLQTEGQTLNSEHDEDGSIRIRFHTSTDEKTSHPGEVFTKLHLDISLDPLQYFSTISTLEMEAYGINVKQAIVVSLTISISSTCGIYVLRLRESDVTVTSYQTVHDDGSNYENNNPERNFFLLSHLIEKRIRSSLLGKSLSSFFEGGSSPYYIRGVIEIVSEVIHEAPCHCIVSGRKHLDDGFRPGAINANAVIRNAIDCGFAGKLLKWYIMNDPAILDITLSSTLATVSGDWNYSDPHLLSTPQIPPEYSPHRVNRRSPWKEYDTIRQIIEVIPSVKNMQQMTSTNTLEEDLNRVSKYVCLRNTIVFTHNMHSCRF